MTDFPEPLMSVDADVWAVYADYLSDRDDPAEARARRIAATLASGRTGLWLQYETGRFVKLSKLHFFNPTTGLGPSFVSIYCWLASCPSSQFPDHREINPTLYPDHFGSRPDVARDFFDKLCELGPFLWLTEADPTVNVPASVAVCPECGGALKVDGFGWYTRTGEPTEVVKLVCCAYSGIGHMRRHRQTDWQPVRDAVERWVRDHVRIRVQEAREVAR